MLRQQLKNINKTQIPYKTLLNNCINLMKQQANLGYTNTTYFIPIEYFNVSNQIIRYLEKQLRLEGIEITPNFIKKCIYLNWG